jgi:hypothetical protein
MACFVTATSTRVFRVLGSPSAKTLPVPSRMPMPRDQGSIAEVVVAVVPKPVNVVVPDHDDSMGALAKLGVQRDSLGNLAKRTWATFDSASQTLKACGS